MRKIRVGVLFGGKSAEHEISILSAKNVIEAIDKTKYEVLPIGIDKKGVWHFLQWEKFLEGFSSSGLIGFDPPLPSEKEPFSLSLLRKDFQKRLDIVFPVLHGPMGEDGTMQGFLEILNIPYVGAGVLGSAIGMDKDVMKRLLRDAKIRTARFITLDTTMHLEYKDAVAQLGQPLFVKPANMGSSIAIHKVKNEDEYDSALKDAFSYDYKVLIEECIKGRELECSVLGNDHPIASLPCELVPSHEFYSYEAKYLDDKGADFIVPAQIRPDLAQQIQTIALKAFKVCNCEGMARVDFFMDEQENIILNEINTIPGFTKISMYPRMWKESGISYPELIHRLIELGLERAGKRRKLMTNYSIPYLVR